VDKSDVQEKVLKILNSLGAKATPHNLEESMSTLELDSLGTMDLILKIEDEFKIEIPEKYLTQEHLNSPSSLLAMLALLLPE
jgi:acyl carrier protein